MLQLPVYFVSHESARSSAQVAATNGAPADGAPQPKKKKRGKPKDAMAPPKPKSAYHSFCAAARDRLKQEKPQLIKDVSAMGKALAEAWAAAPDAEKAAI